MQTDDRTTDETAFMLEIYDITCYNSYVIHYILYKWFISFCESVYSKL